MPVMRAPLTQLIRRSMPLHLVSRPCSVCVWFDSQHACRVSGMSANTCVREYSSVESLLHHHFSNNTLDVGSPMAVHMSTTLSVMGGGPHTSTSVSSTGLCPIA